MKNLKSIIIDAVIDPDYTTSLKELINNPKYDLSSYNNYAMKTACSIENYNRITNRGLKKDIKDQNSITRTLWNDKNIKSSLINDNLDLYNKLVKEEINVSLNSYDISEVSKILNADYIDIKKHAIKMIEFFFLNARTEMIRLLHKDKLNNPCERNNYSITDAILNKVLEPSLFIFHNDEERFECNLASKSKKIQLNLTLLDFLWKNKKIKNEFSKDSFIYYFLNKRLISNNACNF